MTSAMLATLSDYLTANPGVAVLALVIALCMVGLWHWRTRELQRQTTRAFIDKELAAIRCDREHQEWQNYQAGRRRIVDSHPDNPPFYSGKDVA